MLAVTGITGHTGRYFINELVKNRYSGQLRCMVRTVDKAGCIAESGLNAEVVEGTLDSETDIRKLLSGADIPLSNKIQNNSCRQRHPSFGRRFFQLQSWLPSALSSVKQ